MERGNLIRWLLIGTAVFLFLQYGLPAISGKSAAPSDRQPIGYHDDSAPPKDKRTAEATCKLKGKRFEAELSSKGGVLKHAWMLDPKYTARESEAGGKPQPIDLVTTKVQSRMPMRTNLRSPSGSDQIKYDDVDWTIAEQTAKSCTFRYADEQVELTKVFSTTGRPFELTMKLEVKNKADKARKHRLTIEQTDWRTVKETEGSWGRLSELMTEVVARTGKDTERFLPDDFEPDDFSDEGFTPEKWRGTSGPAKWVATSSSYFSKALIALKSPTKPSGEMLIEQWWDSAKHVNNRDDPNFGHVYRARLNYGFKELQPNASTSYVVLAYIGPKEREVLANIGGKENFYDGTETVSLSIASTCANCVSVTQCTRMGEF